MEIENFSLDFFKVNRENISKYSKKINILKNELLDIEQKKNLLIETYDDNLFDIKRYFSKNPYLKEIDILEEYSKKLNNKIVFYEKQIFIEESIYKDINKEKLYYTLYLRDKNNFLVNKHKKTIFSFKNKDCQYLRRISNLNLMENDLKNRGFYTMSNKRYSYLTLVIASNNKRYFQQCSIPVKPYVKESNSYIRRYKEPLITPGAYKKVEPILYKIY